MHGRRPIYRIRFPPTLPFASPARSSRLVVHALIEDVGPLNTVLSRALSFGVWCITSLSHEREANAFIPQFLGHCHWQWSDWRRDVDTEPSAMALTVTLSIVATRSGIFTPRSARHLPCHRSPRSRLVIGPLTARYGTSDGCLLLFPAVLSSGSSPVRDY